MALLFLFAPEGYREEMGTIVGSSQEGTGEHRLYLWKVAWNMFLQNPFWGIGPGSFIYAVPVYEPPGGFYGQYQGFRALHSTHFTIISELAIPGLTLFALFIYYYTRSIRKICRQAYNSVKPQLKFRRKEPPASLLDTSFFRLLSLGLGGGLIGFVVPEF